ncbi:MAG: hypothetical protein ACPGWR_31345, partial [Ardenticatenaceae bacterium]
MYNWLLQLKKRLIEAEIEHDLVDDLVEAFHLYHNPALIEDIEAAEKLFGLTFPPSLKGIYLLFNGIKDVLFPLPTLIANRKKSHIAQTATHKKSLLFS